MSSIDIQLGYRGPYVERSASGLSSVPATVRRLFLLAVFLMPYEYADLGFTSGSSLVKLFVVLACAGYFVFYGISPNRSFSIPAIPLWGFFLYIAVYFVSAFTDPLGGQESAFTLAQLVAFTYVAADLMKDEVTSRRALLTYAIATSIIAVFVLASVPGVTVIQEDRVVAVGDNPNTQAQHMVLSALILIGLALTGHFRRLSRKAIVFALGALLLAGIVATGSRAAIGAFVVGCLVFAIPHYRSKTIFIPLLIVVLAIGWAMYSMVTNADFMERWRIAYEEGDTAGRDLIYGTAIEMIADNPLLGWHPTTAFFELGDRLGRTDGRDVHNLLLDLLLSVGIIGAIPFLLGVLFCIRAAWAGRNGPIGLLPFALLLANLTASMFHTNVSWKGQWFVFAAAIAAGNWRRRELE